MAKTQRGRGRPLVYDGNQKKHIQGLLRKYKSLSKVMNILNADVDASPEGYSGTKQDCIEAAEGERALAVLRNTKMVPQPLGITMPTLSKLAKQAKVTFKQGRPTLDAA